ncbi:flavin reductase [Rhodococcus sp. PAMC28707]|uniref:flavin reductase family protein n=1 Tax=unclassified Rhodococcus (in: high G+C Gram-positive bacteria) TaxID=192944 RepID=UPI00109DC868|nr:MULTISPECIES: flavin reductase family protein [unclassified Rhodococcus (in: high G+C Gram-positive bacteria)]QCB51771.1 flavin reductase [Rhodococcus sp. PAMC28705]QCB60061.1 flavin reductase [Rhodococcus sp. PAMC28707]
MSTATGRASPNQRDEVSMLTTIDPAQFRETLGHYPTGVAVVTAVGADGNPAGMVVGTFSSVSLDPPLVAFFPATTSRSFAQIRSAEAFCVNVLASEQEPLCRRMATPGDDKFEGVGWRAGALGSPILDDAVAWVECTFEDVREAGDHQIVLGHVRSHAIERQALPLLFFQGGYGRFTGKSFIAAPDPDLIHAAHVAQIIRSRVEDIAARFSVNCSVLARIGDDSVQVLSASRAPQGDNVALGHRQPIIPPFGAAYLVHASPESVDGWLERGHDDANAVYRELLDNVRARGYSILLAKPELHRRQKEALAQFESTDRLPQQERAVQQAFSELAGHFCTDLEPDEHYDLASVVVPVAANGQCPSMALRLSGLPSSAPTALVETWIRELQTLASSAVKP